MADVSFRIEKWERELRLYKARTGFSMPEPWQTSLMLKMVPEEFEKELRLRYVSGTNSYSVIRQQIMNFAEQVTGSVTSMDINTAEAEIYDDEGYPLDYMGRRKPGAPPRMPGARPQQSPGTPRGTGGGEGAILARVRGLPAARA